MCLAPAIQAALPYVPYQAASPRLRLRISVCEYCYALKNCVPFNIMETVRFLFQLFDKLEFEEV